MEITLHDDKLSLLSFILKLRTLLVWPALIFSIVVLFRHELRGLASKVTSVGAGSVVAKFDQAVEKTEALTEVVLKLHHDEAAQSALESPELRASDISEIDQLNTGTETGTALNKEPSAGSNVNPYETWRRREADALEGFRGRTPEEKIINIFAEQEHLIRELGRVVGIPTFLPLLETIQSLGGMKEIDAPFAGLLQSQIGVRDIAAHRGPSQLSDLQAREFIKQVAGTLNQLRSIYSARVQEKG